MKNDKKVSKIVALIPKLALKVGEKSTQAACSFWYNQPKVPDAMKKKE